VSPKTKAHCKQIQLTIISKRINEKPEKNNWHSPVRYLGTILDSSTENSSITEKLPVHLSFKYKFLKLDKARGLWLMSVILASQEAEIRRTAV
jgi:hypothetical protein